jgi:heat shock protein HtpX
MWEQIRYNQIRSAILVIVMGAIWILIGFVLGLLASFITHQDLFEGGIYGIMSASILCVFISLIAYFHGDSIILAMTKARKIETNDLQRLYNIVEELKLAAGLAVMPSAYVIDEPAMNAFAVGCRPGKTAVIVTTGLLNKLNRDELQGVIGHEIAHIKNRDVLLISLCITLLGTIKIVTWLFSPKSLTAIFVHQNSQIRDEFMGCALLAFSPVMVIILIFGTLVVHDYPFLLPVLIIIFYIPAFMLLMPFMAKLIYFSISRRREYLADACSALYTRYPEGLASALNKIADSSGQVLAASTITAPIFIVNPFCQQGMTTSDLSDTHPSVSERIRILRSMSYISFTEYDRAYREVRGLDKSVIPASVLAIAGTTNIRSPQLDGLNDIQRARETSDLLWNLNNYKVIQCPCGTKMRLPPSYKQPEIKCPPLR